MTRSVHSTGLQLITLYWSSVAPGDTEYPDGPRSLLKPDARASMPFLGSPRTPVAHWWTDRPLLKPARPALPI